MTTSYFDRWWESVEATPASHWSGAKTESRSRPHSTVMDEPDASCIDAPRPMVDREPRDHSQRERLLLQAITARDSSAVLLLMRLLDEVPLPQWMRSVSWRVGDHAVTAALLDRGDAVMTQTLVVPAGWANTQDRVRRRSIDCCPHAGLRSPSRSWIKRHDGGRPPSGSVAVYRGPRRSGALPRRRRVETTSSEHATGFRTRPPPTWIPSPMHPPKTRSSSLRATSPSPPRKLVANLRDIAADRVCR